MAKTRKTRRELATEWLPVALTDRELSARADELANAFAEHSAVESEKTAAVAGFKSRLESIGDRMGVLARELREKKVDRECQVEHVLNYEEKIVETIRKDSGELVRTRPMTPDELQLRFLDPPSEATGEAAPS